MPAPGDERWDGAAAAGRLSKAHAGGTGAASLASPVDTPTTATARYKQLGRDGTARRERDRRRLASPVDTGTTATARYKQLGRARTS
jgi:hypothetical protein